MSNRPGAAFITRPGIPACALDPAGAARPLSDLANEIVVAQLLAARGMTADVAEGKAALFAQCANALAVSESAAAEAYAFFVPGRIEILGKHTDYCGGRSLLCTVERGFCFVARPRTDAMISMVDVATGARALFPLSSDLSPQAGSWLNYPMTVARRVASNFGDHLRGCDITFISDLPPAAGLSSSSAFIVGAFMVLSAVNHLEAAPQYRQNIKTREDLASYLGCCENGSTFGTLKGSAGVGTFGGSQDHTAILCCKPGMLSMFSFCPVRHESDVRMPPGLVLHVAPTGVIAEKTGAAMAKYNAVSLRARRIVELWNANTGDRRACLADVLSSKQDALPQLRTLLQSNSLIDEELKLSSRLDQFLVESNRLIPATGRLMAAGSWDSVGPLVDESQALAESNLKNQVPETIALHRHMRNAGAMAASAFGAGFGGSVWGLFRE